MHKPCVSVPSPNLLRFLRSQVDDVWFFSSNTRLEPSRFQFQPVHKLLRRKTANSFPLSKRSFGTSKRCQATVESSLLNLDFLRHPPRHEEFSAPKFAAVTIPSKARKGIRPLVRHASTDDQSLLRRWWEKRRAAHPALKAEELSPLPSFLDDVGGTSLARSKAGKAANELRLRCTEINENGDVTLVHGEFKKSELIAKVDWEPDNILKDLARR